MEKVIDFRHLLSSKRTSINLLQKLKLKIVIELCKQMKFAFKHLLFDGKRYNVQSASHIGETQYLCNNHFAE